MSTRHRGGARACGSCSPASPDWSGVPSPGSSSRPDHAVSGIAAHPHENLDPDVDFVCGPLGGPMLQQLADDCRRGPPPRPDRGRGARQRRNQRAGPGRSRRGPAGARLIYRVASGRRADAVPAGRGTGVDRLGAEPDRPGRAAGGPPTRLDDLPHDRQPAAEQGFDPTVAATAFRRPAPIPGAGSGDQPHRTSRPRDSGYHRTCHRATAAAPRRPTPAARPACPSGPS